MVAIGAFMIMIVIGVTLLMSYAIWKLALPRMNGNRWLYMALTIFYFLVAFGIVRCLLFSYYLISNY